MVLLDDDESDKEEEMATMGSVRMAAVIEDNSVDSTTKEEIKAAQKMNDNIESTEKGVEEKTVYYVQRCHPSRESQTRAP